jgi:hypothetical protein
MYTVVPSGWREGGATTYPLSDLMSIPGHTRPVLLGSGMTGVL